VRLGELEAPGFYKGDCRRLLEKLPPDCVHMVVTSPPFWGLRVYEGEGLYVEWDCEEGCEHDWDWRERPSTPGGPIGSSATVGATKAGVQRAMVKEAFCRRCGGWLGAYGNEPTIDMYVSHTVQVLRAVRRVLRPDGLVFWNIGDSYVTGNYGCRTAGGVNLGQEVGTPGYLPFGHTPPNRMPQQGVATKSLALIPHRVALAAQADGWIVRSDVIWAKGASLGPYVGNVMPESVDDRPTKAHEHILMLSKTGDYYWDRDAVAEKASGNSHPRGSGVNPKAAACGQRTVHHQPRQNPSWSAAMAAGLVETRNLRDVWTILTKPYKESHFAPFPPELPRTCVSAATPPRVCSECGAPWRRVVEIQGKTGKDLMKERGQTAYAKALAKPRGTEFKGAHKDVVRVRRTVAWKRGCECFAPPARALVLDPFAGSGTTCLAADGLGRVWLGFDAGDYQRHQEDRLGPLAIMMSKERLG